VIDTALSLQINHFHNQFAETASHLSRQPYRFLARPAVFADIDSKNGSVSVFDHFQASVGLIRLLAVAASKAGRFEAKGDSFRFM
jgi:hypothetical protein